MKRGVHWECTLLAVVVPDDKALGRLYYRCLPGRVPSEQNNQAYGLVRAEAHDLRAASTEPAQFSAAPSRRSCSIRLHERDAQQLLLRRKRAD